MHGQNRLSSCPFCGGAAVVILPLYGCSEDNRTERFMGHRVRCQDCNASITHRAAYATIEQCEARTIAKWNRRASAPKVLSDGIKRIPADEITSDMPPEGIVRYILSASGISWDSFAQQSNLSLQALSDRLSYMTNDTIDWLVATFGYDDEFWAAHDVKGDRSIAASWRRWLRE